MKPTISKESFDDEWVYHIRAFDMEGWIAPSIGSNLYRLVHIPSGAELLKSPATMQAFRSSPVHFGFPILLPPNRISHGRMTVEARTYQLAIKEGDVHHIHGFVYSRPWTVSAVGSDEDAAWITTTFISANHCDVQEQFPHAFEIDLTYRFSKEGVSQRIVVRNSGSEVMPFGLGFHPWFRVPMQPDGAMEDCFLTVPVLEEWLLDDTNIPTGEIIPVPSDHDLNQPTSVQGLTMDTVFTAAGASDERIATLVDRSAHVALHYRVPKAFGFWVIFAGHRTKDFVCIEPYTWATDAPNSKLPASRTGFRVLTPGENFDETSYLSIEQDI